MSTNVRKNAECSYLHKAPYSILDCMNLLPKRLLPYCITQVLGQGVRPCHLPVLISTLVLAPAICAAQERFKPADNTVVLPSSIHAVSGASSSLRDAEQAWRANRNDLDAALRYARAVFMIGLTEGDLRWYGSAKAALLPWWNAPQLSAQGHFMRGLVKQGFHDFAGGLQDIQAAIALDGQQAEYWSWRFAIHLLQSQMDLAAQDCAEIRTRFGTDEADACQAILWYRTGRAAQALPLLQRLVKAPDFQGALTQDWLQFHLGEAHQTLGQYDQAIAVWEKHLARAPRSHSVRLALAELLNHQGAFAKAKRISNVPNPSDALLMQSLTASIGLRDAQMPSLTAAWEARMANQALRKDGLIERPAMIYLIRHGKDLEAGLRMAQANWAIQNEPADAALLAEAAIALKRPEAAKVVLDWMRTTGYTDPTLASLSTQIQDLLKTPAAKP
jgi:tetratricopeptide (TPR) repeat protein